MQDNNPDQSNFNPTPGANAAPELSTPESQKEMILNKKTVLVDIPYNLAAAICYVPILLNVLAPAAWLYSEPKENRYVRYHAVQGLVLLGVYLVAIVVNNTVGFLLSWIPMVNLVFSLLGGVLFFAYVGICFRLGFSAFKGNPGKLPFVSQHIESLMDQYNL